MKKILLFVLTGCLLLALGVPALADEHADRQPDYSRKGSISLRIQTASGTAVGGGTLTLYRVADAVYEDGDNLLAFTEAFASCGLSLDRIEQEESGAPELAAELAKYAASQKLSGTKITIASNGAGVFENLPLGLYLVVQEDPAKGYNAVSPFLVTVPLWDGTQLVYYVSANPKMEPVTEVPPTPPTPTPPDPNLPQTGQLWWPVPVLACVGFVLIGAGIALCKKKRES